MDPGELRAPATGTLLGVWAHPDDEAFLSAGLMARAVDAGERVVVATATRGELGTSDPLEWPPDRLAALREEELSRSLGVLGVHEHRWLGHRDGTLADVPGSLGVAQVVALIEEVRPDTLVTFGPDGMTGHRDHQTVSAWVTEAWRATGGSARLWFATLTPAFHRQWGPLNDEVGLWFEGTTPPTTAEADLAARLVCDDGLLRRKSEALLAHASQVGGLAARVGEETFLRWWAEEAFVEVREGTPRAGG